jgi:hypothetical protein
MINERRFGEDVEGSNHGIFQGTILAFTWRYWRKPPLASNETVSVMFKI